MESKQGMSRRNFIVGAGVATLGAFSLSGCSPQSASSGKSPQSNADEGTTGIPSSWDYETDVVVVGGGGAGMIAACHAKELGSDVILLEKMDMVGGDTAYSSQTAQGFWTGHTEEDDSIECYLEDLKNSHGATEKGMRGIDLPENLPLTEAWLNHCDEMYEWTQSKGMD